MNTIDEALDFAIEQEQIAADFYAQTAEKARSAEMKSVLMEFSEEELRHKQILLNVKAGEHQLTPQQEVLDLKISDYLIDMEGAENLSYQDALIVAMKREQAAFELYDKMASEIPAGELKDVLKGLAVEESKHKLFFERQYDDHVLSQN